MSYLTTSSAIYMDKFQLSKMQFALIFAGNVLGLMLGNRIARWLMEKTAPLSVVGWGNGLMLICLSLLSLLSFLDMATFWPTTALIFLTISAGAVITPTAGGLYLSHYSELAGSASSLSTTIIFCQWSHGRRHCVNHHSRQPFWYFHHPANGSCNSQTCFNRTSEN